MPKLFTSVKTKQTGEKKEVKAEETAKPKAEKEDKAKAPAKKATVKKSITMMKPKS